MTRLSKAGEIIIKIGASFKMVDSESSGDEGNMLESFVMNSNILKKGGAGASGKPGGVVFRPVVTPG